MKRQTDRLDRLAKIAAILSDRALAPLADATARLQRCQDKVDALAQHRQQLAHAGDDPVQAAQLAKHAETLRRSHALALSELARCRATVEMAKAKARPAFGRRHVLDTLRERQSTHGGEGR